MRKRKKKNKPIMRKKKSIDVRSRVGPVCEKELKKEVILH